MKVTQKRRIYKRTVKKGGGWATNNRPILNASEANRRKDFVTSYHDPASAVRRQFMQDMNIQIMCKETFKIFMLIFKAMKENNTGIDANNYENFIKHLDIESIIDDKTNPLLHQFIYDGFDRRIKLMVIYLQDEMKKHIKIYQSGTNGTKDFYYKFVIDKYMPFFNYKTTEAPLMRNSYHYIEEIDTTTIKNNTKAIFYVYPYRERWGAVNLQFIIINTEDNSELHNKWFRFHYNDKKDKYSGMPDQESTDLAYIRDILDMAYGMTVFRDTNIIFPPDMVPEINSVKDSNQTVQELGEEPPEVGDLKSEFVEEQPADVEEPVAVGDSNSQPSSYENPPLYNEEEYPPASGGRRRRKTHKPRKRSKKTKKGRRKINVKRR